MKRYGSFLWAFAFVFTFISICAAAALAKDKLIVVDQYDATTLDPIAHNDVPSSRACYEIYDTLIFLDNEGNVSPGLAESWEFLSGTDYKFNLRKGAKFHNDEDLKAVDIQFSIERATTNAGAKIATFSQNVKNVEIVDDYTVIVHLKKVDYSFFSSLSHSWASIVSKKATEAAGESYGMNPVGTGPFKFVSWQKGNKYVFERFENYWGPKPKYKTLEVRSVPEPTSRTIALETGDADIAFPIAHNDLKRVGGNSGLILYRKPQNSTAYIGFNASKKPFDDVRVRHAIFEALDVVTIQAASYRGVGKVPGTLVPSTVKYSINDKIPPHVQDVGKAKKLLAEAGVKNLKLEIWTNERKERVDSATIIQAQLEEVGIQSEIRVLEWGAYINGLMEQKHDLFILGWVSAVPDPNFAVSGLLESSAIPASNLTFYNDPKLDALLDRGRSLPDGDERASVYKEMQLYINEQLPMIYLHNDESIAGTQKNVKGFSPRSNEIHSFREVYFE
ncbi:MAG: ABC transporter substrate-binding protein [Synergistaceae bacterium]|jgi:peptide/nickel transport system substrate-binding protein|nr:ABC transporter substrate-binding protein [Synergistaceae bacterium]